MTPYVSKAKRMFQMTWMSDIMLHPNTMTTMYGGKGRGQEVEELSIQVKEIQLRVFGTKHLDTLTSVGKPALTNECKDDRRRQRSFCFK